MSGNELEITQANFEAETKQGVVLVDFWAPWCGPCQKQGPILEKVAAALAGKAKVGKCNVDDQQELAARFGVMSIPTLIILKDGKPVDQMVGLRSENELVSKLTALVA